MKSSFKSPRHCWPWWCIECQRSHCDAALADVQKIHPLELVSNVLRKAVHWDVSHQNCPRAAAKRSCRSLDATDHSVLQDLSSEKSVNTTRARHLGSHMCYRSEAWGSCSYRLQKPADETHQNQEEKLFSSCNISPVSSTGNVSVTIGKKKVFVGTRSNFIE